MPYIKKTNRELLELGDPIRTPGELNYCITEMIKQYVKDHGLSYRVLNDVVGALESSKLEFYRRVVVPYENKKIEQNGDVYEGN